MAIQDVEFTYPQTAKQIFNKLKTSFVAGHIYGIIGANGKGKSTLFKLLTGQLNTFYKGSVCMDATDLASIDLDDLRKHEIAYVSQDPVFINGSLWDNLTLFCEEKPSKEAVVDLMKRLNIDYLLNQDEGFDTAILSAQNKFSGGEAQKITIIRSLLKQESLLLLDEPSSALDAETTQVLGKLLQERKQGQIILIISHDQKMLDACDTMLEL